MVNPIRVGGRADRRAEHTDRRPGCTGVEIHRSFDQAEKLWRDFEADALCTPYQRFDWQEAWYRHIGRSRNLEPLIVVARSEDGHVHLIWPLMVGTAGAARVAIWAGGKFSNYNLGLYDPESASALDRDALLGVMRRLREDAGLDALSLRNQPETWRGIANPLSALPHQASPSNAYSLALRPDFDALFAELRSGSTRKKLRRSERRIADEYGRCSLRRPQTPEDVDRLLEAFARQKTARMQEKSLPNVFAAPGVMSFFGELAVRGIGSDESLIDLFWLDAGGRIAATWAGTAAYGRMSGIFNSFDLDDFAQHQPGEVLLRQLIEDCCSRGFTDFDLGIGEAQYKDSWCPRVDRLFDSFLPLTATGWVHTSVAMTGFRLKRAVKQSKFLRDLTDRFR